MIVLSEASLEAERSSAAHDNINITEAARLMGCTVYYIPKDFSLCENAENALWHIPQQPDETPGIWIGFIPSPERYEAIYNEALRKRIRLVNTPEQHLTAQEFDRAFPLLAGITPESLMLLNPDEYTEVSEQLGFPVFVRGSVRSRKAAGWKACVAYTEDELRELVEQFFKLEYRSRGRVIVRRLVNLKHFRFSDEGFPLGREYRVFVYKETILGYGYYWEGDDPLRNLSADEEYQVLNLAVEAAGRLGVPFIAIDVGQMTNERWTVIEVNDAQFAGACQTPLLALWSTIRQIK
ncbi:MAG TPA: ATP-grasp domain-containing protein [Blastocatellia bacterium]|nr:ATP-grasp domain-containing protein [Blastocatellia bacterium]